MAQAQDSIAGNLEKERELCYLLLEIGLTGIDPCDEGDVNYACKSVANAIKENISDNLLISLKCPVSLEFFSFEDEEGQSPNDAYLTSSGNSISFFVKERVTKCPVSQADLHWSKYNNPLKKLYKHLIEHEVLTKPGVKKQSQPDVDDDKMKPQVQGGELDLGVDEKKLKELNIKLKEHAPLFWENKITQCIESPFDNESFFNLIKSLPSEFFIPFLDKYPDFRSRVMGPIFLEVISLIEQSRRKALLSVITYEEFIKVLTYEEGRLEGEVLDFIIEGVKKQSESIVYTIKQIVTGKSNGRPLIKPILLNNIVGKLEVDSLDGKMLDLIVYHMFADQGFDLQDLGHLQEFLKKVALSSEVFEKMDTESKNYFDQLLERKSKGIHTVTRYLKEKLELINKIDVKDKESAIEFLQQYGAAELKKILEDEDLKILLNKYFGKYLCFDKDLVKNLDPEKYKILLDCENLKDISIEVIQEYGEAISPDIFLEEQAADGRSTYSQNFKKLCVDLIGSDFDKLEKFLRLACEDSSVSLKQVEVYLGGGIDSLEDNMSNIITDIDQLIKINRVIYEYDILYYKKTGETDISLLNSKLLGSISKDHWKTLVQGGVDNLVKLIVLYNKYEDFGVPLVEKVFSNLDDGFAGILATLDDIVKVLDACDDSSELIALVFQKIKDSLPDIITNAADLAKVLGKCNSDENQSQVIEALKGKLPEIITSAADLFQVLDKCWSNKNKNQVIGDLKEQGVLTDKITSAADLAQVLDACYSADNKKQVIGALEGKLPEIITSADDLAQVLRACGPDKNKKLVIKSLLGSLEGKFPEIITSAGQLKIVLELFRLNKDKKQVIGALKEKLPGVITSAYELAQVLGVCGSPANQNQVIEALKEKGLLSDKIKNAYELVQVLDACGSEENKKQVIEFLTAKGVLSGKIQNAAELVQVLGKCGPDKNKKQVIEALKEKGVLSDKIRSVKDLAQVLGACGLEENKNQVIASLSSGVINSIFQNMHYAFVEQRRRPLGSHNKQDMLYFSQVVAKYIFLKKEINYVDQLSIDVLAKLLFVNISYEGSSTPKMQSIPKVGVNVLPVVSQAIEGLAPGQSSRDFKQVLRTLTRSKLGGLRGWRRDRAKSQAYQEVMRALDVDADADAGGAAAAAGSL